MKKNNQSPRKGRCTNFVNCQLADNGDIQEVQPGDDFKCKQCGHELEEIIVKLKWKKLLWVLLAALIIVAIVLLFIRECDRPPVLDDTVIINDCGDTIVMRGLDTLKINRNMHIDTTYNAKGDTIIMRGCDTIAIKKFKKVEPKPKREDEKPPVIHPVTPVSPAYGIYSGNRDEHGEPHGSGGRVKVTTEYHWGNHVFSPGDVIENTTYEHGVLKHGRVRKNGGTIDF